jgi:pimeloyl-ACP methyl ester carboxylesterase
VEGEPAPEEVLDSAFGHFDQGTQRAILRLYRSASPGVLAAAGAQLDELHKPALVAWGMRDPYIPGRFARAYAEVLGAGEPLELAAAGHWPWLESPELIDTVARFLDGEPG